MPLASVFSKCPFDIWLVLVSIGLQKFGVFESTFAPFSVLFARCFLLKWARCSRKETCDPGHMAGQRVRKKGFSLM